MNVNYLSKEQIDELSNRIAAKVENVYVGIAVWMGGDPVEPFTLENYQNLAGKFIKSGEVRGDNPEKYVPPAKLLSDLQADLTASISTGVTPAMVTTLLKAFVFIKRKNAAPTWMFVFYEEPPKQPQTTKHNSSSKVLSPSSSIGQPSPRIPQQQPQRNQRGKGRDQQEPQRAQQPRLEYGQVAIRTTDTPRSHLGPSMFFTPFSTLNSYDAKVVSTHGVISPKPSSVEAITSRKSAFINLIKESIQSKPYLKLIVDKSNGHISIMNIDPDEVFITSEFQFCPLHSGRTADSFQPISMDNVSRLSSDCCGYITADADCFDMCYKCVSTVIDDAETAEINKQRENIKTILKTLTAEIEAFNSKCTRLDNVEREQIQAKQRAIVEKKRFEVEFGSAEGSIQNMQHLITHAYFNKIKRINTERRRDYTEEVPPEIPVISYTPLSSFFDNFENIVNQMEDVTFSFTIGGVTVPFDRRYTSIVLANYKDARTTINEGRYKVVKVKQQGIVVLQLEFHGVNITLNPNDSSAAMRHLTFSRDPNNVEYAFADISISPVYTDVSYQKLTLNLGKLLATQLGIVEFITDRLDVYQYLGACFLSDFSEIIDALREVETNPYRMRKYSIVHSNDVNRCDISFTQIESIISEISTQLQTRDIADLHEITLMSDEDYKVKIAVEKSVALEILEDLSNFPKFEQAEDTDNLNVVLTDDHSEYVIPVDDIDSFLKQIRSNLDDLSAKGKKSTVPEKDDDEIPQPQTFALTAANLVAGGLTENGWSRSTSPALATKETEFDFSDIFSNISFGSKKSQKQRRGAKKAKSVDDDKSETGTQLSGKTGITMLTDATTNYNRTYFGDPFDVMGYSFTGYDAEILSNKYYMIKGTDFESRVAKLRISRLPLIKFNAEYIKATLFAEEAASEVPWFMEHGDNFTLLLVMVLFGSNAHHFRFPNEEEKKLKYQLDKLNPYTYKTKLSFGIPLSQANKGRQLRKFADRLETIDKIMIQTKKKTIETLGAEIADVVFTGIIHNGQYVNFENRDVTIPTAGRVMETRIRLIGEYENHILPFIAECLADDQLNNGDQLIYYNIRDFVVFSTEVPKESVHNDSIIPGIPLYSTFNPNAIRTRSIFDAVVDRYAVGSQRLSALHTTQADINLRTVMRILFPDVTNVSLREVIPAMDDIVKTDLDVEITANKFGVELILLSLTSKFSQLIQQLKLNPQDPVVENLLLQLGEVETCIKWILTDAIGRKAVKDIPSQKEFPGYVQELLQLVEATLGEIPAKVIDGRTCHLLDLYRAFVDAFSGVPQDLIERRAAMMDYMITLMSNIHDVRVERNLELENEVKYELVNEVKYASFGDSIPKGSSIYDVAQQNVADLISIMKSRKNDDAIRVKVGFPSEKLDVYLRYKIFLKFKDLLLAAPTKLQFNNIMKSIPYYLTTIAKKILRDSKQDIYDFYLTTNLGGVMSSIHANTMALLKQEQGVMITELPLIFKIRDDKDSANLAATKAKESIDSLKNEIERDRQVLIDKFVQYASVIDVIVNAYKSRKQSYDKKDSSFDDLIKDLMTNLDVIRRDYDNVKNLDVRIILSIFDDNNRIFNLRRRIFREFKFDQNSIDAFGECFAAAVGIFVANYKSSSEDQIRILNEQLSGYGMTLESSMAELENKLSQVINSVERDEMRSRFIICRIAQYLFDMISVESMRIKDKLFTKRVEKFSVPHKQSQPRTAGYGSLLNTGLDVSPPIVDMFTYNDIQTLGKNINQFLESILNGLSTIDCGPGMHTLSDLLEHFIKYIRDLYVGNNDTQELQNVRKKYDLFIKVADKSVNDIINSSEFDTFVNIINGTFSSLDATISSIPYFRSGEMPYPVRQNVTTNFFRGILLTIHDVISAGEMRIADLLRHLSNNTGVEYSFENVDSLLSNISEMNEAVITFIDEYVDEKGQIIDPENVCELRKNYYLTTSGEFMNRMFEKLNYCIRRYIYEKETQFKVRVADRLRVYIELFNAKMNLLKNLEKFIMMR